MPSVANIVANDDAATPVSHTFIPLGPDEKGVWWYEQSLPVPLNGAAAKRIGVSLRKNYTISGKLDGSSKFTLTVMVPTLKTVGTADSGLVPVPQVDYITKIRLEADLPDRGSLQERKDAFAFTRALLGTSGVVWPVARDVAPLY